MLNFVGNAFFLGQAILGTTVLQGKENATILKHAVC